MTILSEEKPKKACRGSPKKMQTKTSAAEPSGLNVFIPPSPSSALATQAGPTITVTNFNLAIEAGLEKHVLALQWPK
jgi:hypothetical protein